MKVVYSLVALAALCFVGTEAVSFEFIRDLLAAEDEIEKRGGGGRGGKGPRKCTAAEAAACSEDELCLRPPSGVKCAKDCSALASVCDAGLVCQPLSHGGKSVCKTKCTATTGCKEAADCNVATGICIKQDRRQQGSAGCSKDKPCQGQDESCEAGVCKVGSGSNSGSNSDSKQKLKQKRAGCSKDKPCQGQDESCEAGVCKVGSGSNSGSNSDSKQNPKVTRGGGGCAGNTDATSCNGATGCGWQADAKGPNCKPKCKAGKVAGDSCGKEDNGKCNSLLLCDPPKRTRALNVLIDALARMIKD